MEFTERDRDALYQTWMSQKSKMRLTQMEFAKKTRYEPTCILSDATWGKTAEHVVHQPLLPFVALRTKSCLSITERTVRHRTESGLPTKPYEC